MVETFSEKEWKLIEVVPVAVFYYVANADGEISLEEKEAFRKDWRIDVLKRKITGKKKLDAFLQRMFIEGTLVEEFLEMNEIMKKKSQKQIRKFLVDFRELLKKLSKEDQLKVKMVIVDLAKKVAEASGGFFSKVSKEENKAISEIEVILRV